MIHPIFRANLIKLTIFEMVRVGNDINKKYTFFSNDQVIKDDAIKKLRLSFPFKRESDNPLFVLPTFLSFLKLLEFQIQIQILNPI